MAGVPLVVVEDDRHGVAQRGRVLEDDLADARMLDDRPPLGRRQRRRLVEDRLRDRHLADVMEQRRDPDPIDFGLGQLELVGHLDHDRRDQRGGLAAAMRERGDDRCQGGRRGVARQQADLPRPGAPGVRDRGSRDARVSSGSSKM